MGNIIRFKVSRKKIQNEQVEIEISNQQWSATRDEYLSEHGDAPSTMDLVAAILNNPSSANVSVTVLDSKHEIGAVKFLSAEDRLCAENLIKENT